MRVAWVVEWKEFGEGEWSFFEAYATRESGRREVEWFRGNCAAEMWGAFHRTGPGENKYRLVKYVPKEGEPKEG